MDESPKPPELVNWRKVSDLLAEALLEIWGDRHTATCQACGDAVQEDLSLHFPHCKVSRALQAYSGGKLFEDLRARREGKK